MTDTTDSADDLHDYNHPYYATHGNYFTNSLVGHNSGSGYDGIGHHWEYLSWNDFKTGKVRSYTPEEIELRNKFGLTDDRLNGSMYNSDFDYNYIHRFDCNLVDPDEEAYHVEYRSRHYELSIFGTMQRKAIAFSVTVLYEVKDQKEIESWLWPRWLHIMRMWAPISGWPLDNFDEHGNPIQGQCLEHSSLKLMDAAHRMINDDKAG